MPTQKPFLLEDLGIDQSDTFPGVSTVYTPWSKVFVGIGASVKDAAEDALEIAFCEGVEFPPSTLAAIEEELLLLPSTESPELEQLNDREERDCSEIFTQHYVALFLA